MKYFKTIHERNSARLTVLIALLIILSIFVIGPSFVDSPHEYGVAVNFGTTNFGTGNVQPLEAVKLKNVDINEHPKETPIESEPKEEVEPEKSTDVEEKVLTQDNTEAIALKKAEKLKEVKRLEAERKAEEAKKQKEQDAKRKKLDALMGGLTNAKGEANGSEGDDDKQGDKGDPTGNPYAPSYFGGSGLGSGGVGYGLNGRGKATYTSVKQNCNESGLVIVKIIVNQNGNVIDATAGVKGTTNTATCLLEPALEIAKSHKWQPDPNAPQKQIGFVKVNFNLGQ